MALLLRSIAGVYRNAQNVITPNVEIVIEPLHVFGDVDDLIHDGPIILEVDGSGAYNEQFLASDAVGGYVRYAATLHTLTRKFFDLPAGDLSPISLSTLIAAFDPAQEPSASQMWLDLDQRVGAIEQGGLGTGFIHTQSTPASEWIVNHNFGYYPHIEVYSTGGEKILANTLNTSLNQTRVYFAAATAGSARCI
jgi:hypothetical protein